MRSEVLYPAGDTLTQLCGMLQLGVDAVLARAGVDPGLMSVRGGRMDAEEFFALWTAVMDAANDPELPITLGQGFAHGPFTPSLLAFTCSATVRDGLERLSLFKPLMGPIFYDLTPGADTLEIAFRPSVARQTMPLSLALFEQVFVVECCRVCTARPVTPLGIGLPQTHPAQDAAARYFGIAPHDNARPVLTLSRRDAERVLISENPQVWDAFAPNLRRQLADTASQSKYASRVTGLLIALLPSGGEVTIDLISDRLNLSRRSLQRHLQAEGRPFQTLVQETRRELAEHYLADETITLNEIGYLLGYDDPNSFFRSFRQWTGMTPSEARAQRRRKFDQRDAMGATPA
ncbi:helix-turn-helix domain-containing protein [Devosia sp.]|uniref:helix-turn-helix domain-containing protein n=1 Tax=Devosia sp. TaxID=1871048 RepID=UPI003A90B1DF